MFFGASFGPKDDPYSFLGHFWQTEKKNVFNTFQAKIQPIILKWLGLVTCVIAKVNVERRNSKGRSGKLFDLFYKKNFSRFLTRWVKSGTDIIDSSIESSHFLFCHKKILSRIFENFVGNRQSTFHEFKFSVYLHKP